MKKIKLSKLFISFETQSLDATSIGEDYRLVRTIGEFNMKNTQTLKSRRGIEHIEDLTNGEIIAKRYNDCREMKELVRFNNLKQKIAEKSNKCKICSREYLKYIMEKILIIAKSSMKNVREKCLNTKKNAMKRIKKYI